MGKGDKKTRRGKTYSGSYGNVRKHAAKTSAATGAVTKGTARKTAIPRRKPA